MTTSQKIGLALLYTGTISMIVISELNFLEPEVVVKGTEVANCLMLIGTSVLTGSLANTTTKVKEKIEKGETITPSEVAELVKDDIKDKTADKVETTDNIADTGHKGIMFDIDEIHKVIENIIGKHDNKVIEELEQKDGKIWKNNK